ncbi:polysaccharide biosynthesis protein [Paenibacillus eucommiae]|uniref:FlaA1/EpsC-like NDP-sugar epimerase n=1 Tax=Paenibacillus eucommiae TaxID=1355755 RepID=A0ABS4IUQ4_9BACL|nr:nucleoside-diphosphate sugar epimerase/dehydratase [Paenibacillus eucommiae]MBP1990299.1 FlaA1/EpsC-like NDP-sugar epimerase [Paenibacillus eucommiae]
MVIKRRVLFLFFIDLFIIWLSVGGSYFFHSDGPGWSEVLQYGLIFSIFCGGSLLYFRMYNRIWQYASVGELVAIFKAVTLGGIASYGIAAIVMGTWMPFLTAVTTLETMLLLMGGSRFIWRLLRVKPSSKAEDTRRKILMIGAGDCGALITKEMLGPEFSDQKVIGFVDDDPKKQGMHVYGLPVLGDRSQIEAIVSKYAVDDIIIAIPSAPQHEIAEMITICKGTGVKVKIIPALNDYIHGRVSVRAIRDVSVEDLLGRDPVVIDLEGIANYVSDKVLLITGAGGSIGSELCRQIASFKPEKLLLLGHGENSIYNIEMELRRLDPSLNMETIIADIQDRPRINDIFRKYKPQVIFHAAAHKHVPLMERNPAEAVKNNVFGTKNVADCADKYGAEKFVMISSDKAVNPTSVMGATKRIAEMYVQSLDACSATKFVAVRFGNVLGSRGSVIPRFKEQISIGGPVTVTHPEMVRFFMTIPEAVQLVIQAGSFAKGGEIFVLDMGAPVKILDLAEDLIRLSGYEPYSEIAIEFSGIREGEKLFEELLSDEEVSNATQHERIYIGKPVNIDRSELELEFKRLEKVLAEGGGGIRDVIGKLVPLHRSAS